MARRARRRAAAWVSGVVLTVGVVAMVVAAVLVSGLPVRHVELNDGGIWVTSDADGLFGRVNRPAGSLDGVFNPPGGAQPSYSLDIVQDGSAVAAWDKGASKLYAVDVARAVSLTGGGGSGLDLPGAAQVGMGGGSLAVLDPASGQVRATREDPAAGLSGLAGLDDQSPPLASVAPEPVGDQVSTTDGTGDSDSDSVTVDVKAALVVATDGTVFAVSGAGRVTTVRVSDGVFDAASYRDLGHAVEDAALTTVGDELVVLDRASGVLMLPGGQTVSIAGSSVTLQQPGPAADSVLVATDSSLLMVDLGSGAVTTLTDAVSGSPAAPVRLGDVVHAAWAGAGGGYFFQRSGGELTPGNLADPQALVSPVFRVNRGAIILNDLATGAVWDLADQRRVDDWSSLRPPPEQGDSDKEQQHETTSELLNRPPKAVDDLVGARPGRTTLLYVLDNDSDPAGSILSVTKVSTPSVASARVAISPDGQTVAITVAQAGGPIQFTYTVDDGRQSADATVTVQVRGAQDNAAPNLRPNYEAPVYTLASGGRLAVPVLENWRDFDGDPIALAGASVDAGSVTARADGFVDFQAPVEGGNRSVAYRVTDGLSEPVPDSLLLTVKAPTDTTPVPAITQPDVARGQVGQPITLRPLDNDLPGSDATKPDAVLALAGDVGSPNNATVVTNLRSGVVVVTATRPGAYVMDYKVAFGNAPFANGQLRVDVVPVPTSPAPPVAMPDTAVLHGQVPTMVDVLANDFDPAGAVLVVQHAQAADPTSGVQVGIIDGRWVRLSSRGANIAGASPLVRYTISDGLSAPVTGEITVSQLPAEPDTKPVPTDDSAVVRAGDAVTVAVLDNDSNPAGAPMTLASNVLDAPGLGQLAITAPGVSDPGAAYVTGNLVRYVAPASVTEPTTVSVSYVVADAAGDTAVGHLKVLVNPAPGPDLANRPPSPVPVETRAVSGQTITITIPTSGVDVDGDAVNLVGLASAPTLGRVEGFNATSLTYVAFPTSAGTDSFDYRVVDRFGAVGTATIRVGVTPPGTPQPPVAVDDTITAAPGATVHADVLANDLRAPGDTVAIDPLADNNPGLPDTVALVNGVGPIDVVAPDATGKPTVVTYRLDDGIGSSLATLTVRSQDGFNNPPVVYDAYPAAGADDTTVTVDMLKQAFDPDGDQNDLTITTVGAADAVLTGASITLPVGDVPYTVAYAVKDGGGASAVGLIHVPTPGSGAPYAKPGVRVTLNKNATTNVSINDYVLDPRARSVKLTTTDKIWASPPTGLTVTNDGTTGLVVTGVNDYVGPGALTFEVTDGSSLTDPDGRSAVITIPVQVGPETPVLHCPDDPLHVVEGGDIQHIDVATVCHVWVADPTTLPGLAYTASWQGDAHGLTLDGSGTRTLEVGADSGTAPGTTGTLVVGVAGTDATPSSLHVTVDAAPPLAIAPITIAGVRAGETATIDVAGYVQSQLRDPVLSVISAAQSLGDPATVETSGTLVKITPAARSHGQLTFVMTVTDVTDTARIDRQVTGQITLTVFSVPDAPEQPQLGAQLLSRSVELSWPTPANNGAPIQEYEIDYAGGSQSCAASPCLITGLTNGNTYTFTVKARNLAGWSDPSPASGPAVPNTVPGAVTGLVVSDPQDHTLHLAWTAPTNDGTPVTQYHILWSGGGSGTSASTSFDPTGLDNDVVYTFTIVAENAAGLGPDAEVDGQPAGAPPTPGAASFDSVNLAGSTTRAVNVSWAPVDPNGPGPTTYTLTRSGGAGTVTVCANVTATSCADDGIANDGKIYTYSLIAANAAAGADPANHTSAASPGTQMEATATPEPITGYTIAATGVDGQAKLTFTVGASHGASSTVGCTWSGGGCGTWTFPVGGQSNVTETINGLPNGSAQTVSLQDCNGGGGGTGAGNPCDSAVGATVTTYGPITGFSVSGSASGTDAIFTISVNPNGYPVTVTVDGSSIGTTGVGTWSQQVSYTIGYSATKSITVQVVDTGGGRNSQTQTASVTTGAAPPPPGTVNAYRGAKCGPSVGTTCGSNGDCSNVSCGYLYYETANFSGTVTCTFQNQTGVTGNHWPDQTVGNGLHKTTYYFGYPGDWVSVTCGGITYQFNWPTS